MRNSQEHPGIKNGDMLFGKTVIKRCDVIDPSADTVAQLEEAWKLHNRGSVAITNARQQPAPSELIYSPVIDRGARIEDAQIQVADSQPRGSGQFFVGQNESAAAADALGIYPSEEQSYPDMAGVWRGQENN